MFTLDNLFWATPSSGTFLLESCPALAEASVNAKLFFWYSDTRWGQDKPSVHYQNCFLCPKRGIPRSTCSCLVARDSYWHLEGWINVPTRRLGLPQGRTVAHLIKVWAFLCVNDSTLPDKCCSPLFSLQHFLRAHTEVGRREKKKWNNSKFYQICYDVV